MPTCWQIDNARRLADTLDKVAAEYPEHFDMSNWMSAPLVLDDLFMRHKAGEHPAECGTTGCALGWAPYALGEPLKRSEGWPTYSRRVLGVASWSHWWSYLFHDMTTPTGAEGARAAADRLREYVAAHEGDCTDG